jgi:hypothetical protein
MATPYAGTATDHATILLPDDADDAAALSWNVALESLHDECMYLKSRDVYHRTLNLDTDSTYLTTASAGTAVRHGLVSGIVVPAGVGVDVIVEGSFVVGIAGNVGTFFVEAKVVYTLNGGAYTDLGARSVIQVGAASILPCSVRGSKYVGAGTLALYLELVNGTSAPHVVSIVRGPMAFTVQVRGAE